MRANIPFFSIVIPTYNRVDFLKSLVTNLLNQSLKSIELIVVDNSEDNEAKRMINKFEDRRIVYKKNKKNVGWIKSLEKGISISKGKYIILIGDDDNIYDQKSLVNIKEIIKQNKPGYLRVNYLSKIAGGEVFDFSENKYFKKNTFLKKESGDFSLLEFIRNSDCFFVTGIILKNDFGKNIKMINSELAPWFKYSLAVGKKYGCYYYAEPCFVNNWVLKESNPNHPFFYLVKNKFTFEEYVNEVRSILKKSDSKKILESLYKQLVRTLPANKYSTNNKNLIKCAKRIQEIFPEKRIDPVFLIYFAGSYLSPKIVLRLIRSFCLYRIVKNVYSKN